MSDPDFPFKNLERFPQLYKFVYGIWARLNPPAPAAPAKFVHDSFLPVKDFDFINAENGSGIEPKTCISLTKGYESSYLLLSPSNAWKEEILNYFLNAPSPVATDKMWLPHRPQIAIESYIMTHLLTGNATVLEEARLLAERYYTLCATPIGLLRYSFNPVTGETSGDYILGMLSHWFPSFAMLGALADPVWNSRLKSVVTATEQLRNQTTGLLGVHYNPEDGTFYDDGQQDYVQAVQCEYAEALVFAHKCTGDSFYLDVLQNHIDRYLAACWNSNDSLLMRANPDGVLYSDQYLVVQAQTLPVGLCHLYSQGKGQTYLDIAKAFTEKCFQIGMENGLAVERVFYNGEKTHVSRCFPELLRACTELFRATNDSYWQNRGNEYFANLATKLRSNYGFLQKRTDTLAVLSAQQPEYIWECINQAFLLNSGVWGMPITLFEMPFLH